MRCSRCGTEAKPGTKFCEGCGTELKSVQSTPGATGLRCTNCGTLSAANAKFCEGCGLKVEWTAAPAQAQQPTPPRVRPAPVPASPPPVSPSMKCANCGTVSSPGVKFCEGCGAVLGTAVQAMPQQGQRSSKSLLLIPLLLVLGGALGYFGYQRYRSGQMPPAPPEPLPVAIQEPRPPVTAPVEPPPEPVTTPPVVTPPAPTPVEPSPARPPVTKPVDTRPAPAPVTPSQPQLPAVTSTPAPEPARVPILRPDRDEPAPPAPTPPPVERPAEPVQPAYNGPSSGVIVWSGQLEKNGTVVIEGGSPSAGSLNGGLPGVPVSVNLDVKEFAVAESPSPGNGWSKIVFRSRNKRHSVVTIQWKVIN